MRFKASFSIKSFGSIIPAVSAIFKGIPWISIISSIASRVVPAIGLTMARSSFKSALSREDLPTLARPNITALRPSRRILPCVADFNRPSILLDTLLIIRSIFLAWAIGSPTTAFWPVAWVEATHSSGKSILTSDNAITSNNSFLIRLSSTDNCPFNCFIPLDRARPVLALIISITASARLRSILPFKKARLVNSPASAKRAPLAKTRSRISLKTTIPL